MGVIKLSFSPLALRRTQLMYQLIIFHVILSVTMASCTDSITFRLTGGGGVNEPRNILHLWHLTMSSIQFLIESKITYST